MNIFISFAGIDRDLAETLAASISDRRDQVFVDSLGLAATEKHHNKIRAAILEAELFILMLSPEAVEKGAYVLSELAMFRECWPSPEGRVIVVEIRSVDADSVPTYVRGIHRLRPAGDPVAEILHAVEQVRAAIEKARPGSIHRRRFLFGFLLIGGAGGAWWWSRPKLDISGFILEGTRSDCQGLPVDNDTLLVRWSSIGPPSSIRVCLQALATGRRTRDFVADSGDLRLSIEPDDYKEILTDRRLGATNRVKVLVHGLTDRFESRTLDVYVGLTIFIGAYEETIKVAPMIDNRLVADYSFDARIVIPHRTEIEKGISLGPRFQSANQDHHEKDLDEYSWGSVSLAYFGPNDPRLVDMLVVTDY